jgi:hypothetical protein
MDSSFLEFFISIFLQFFQNFKFDRPVFDKLVKPVPNVFPVFTKTGPFFTDISIHPCPCELLTPAFPTVHAACGACRWKKMMGEKEGCNGCYH